MEDTKRVLNTPINATLYNEVNGIRVAHQLSWRQVVELALLAWQHERNNGPSAPLKDGDL